MNKLRKKIGFTFKQLEQTLWTSMVEEFAKTLTELLKHIDDLLFEGRDKDRYVSHGLVPRKMGTLFGRDVNFKRRRYRDLKNSKEVYLLDDVLKIPANTQVSPALMALMLTQVATTNSYRKAAESVAGLLGFQAVSHETVRQAVLQLGKELEQTGAEERKNPQGRRKTKVVFLEVDGMWVPLQQWDKGRLEEKMVTSHEGWEPRYKGSREYKLKHLRQFRSHQSDDFWDDASRWAYSHYDIDEDTLVVINGDRAPWIRKGVEYFPNAIYQVDRFHLQRDLKRLFGDMTKTYRRLLRALDGNDATGATFIALLAEATFNLKNEKKREEAHQLLQDLLTMPEATVDYRVRLKALGMSTAGLRGMGAAESQVERFSDRIRGGRSWRPTGLAAMMELQRTRHEGIFGKIIDRLEERYEQEDSLVHMVKDAVRKAVRSASASLTHAFNVNVPIKSVGTTASGGLSNLFHRLNESGMPTNT